MASVQKSIKSAPLKHPLGSLDRHLIKDTGLTEDDQNLIDEYNADFTDYYNNFPMTTHAKTGEKIYTSIYSPEYMDYVKNKPVIPTYNKKDLNFNGTHPDLTRPSAVDKRVYILPDGSSTTVKPEGAEGTDYTIFQE